MWGKWGVNSPALRRLVNGANWGGGRQSLQGNRGREGEGRGGEGEGRDRGGEGRGLWGRRLGMRVQLFCRRERIILNQCYFGIWSN